jgi:hypothetical protein
LPKGDTDSISSSSSKQTGIESAQEVKRRPAALFPSQGRAERVRVVVCFGFVLRFGAGNAGALLRR